jgi:hypothetical protein
MAKKRSSRKITRRDAVTMLGAAAVLGGARGKAEAAESAVQGLPCAGVAEVSEFDMVVNGKTRLAMMANACCGESRTAVLAGTEVPRHKPSANTKSHLKRLTDTLQTATLDEYCFMIWGLSEAQALSLYKTMPERLALKPRAQKK